MIKKIALFFAILSPFTKFSFGQITVTNFDKKIITEAPKPIPYDSLKNYSTYQEDYYRMTVEMCEVAWGKPFDKSSTITSDQKAEIWSYGWKRSLYFVNGILKRIEL
jgi:hypothetical protein